MSDCTFLLCDKFLALCLYVPLTIIFLVALTMVLDELGLLCITVRTIFLIRNRTVFMFCLNELELFLDIGKIELIFSQNYNVS